jgi:hypothetical protein
MWISLKDEAPQHITGGTGVYHCMGISVPVKSAGVWNAPLGLG